MFGFFKRRGKFGDQEKIVFADAITSMLEVQLMAAGGRGLVGKAGDLNSMALGYVYGLTDAALRSIGQDMGDVSIGVPIMFQVLRRICPDDHERCLRYLIATLNPDRDVAAAVMNGGQQYNDYINGQIAAPMGLARYLLVDE